MYVQLMRCITTCTHHYSIHTPIGIPEQGRVDITPTPHPIEHYQVGRRNPYIWQPTQISEYANLCTYMYIYIYVYIQKTPDKSDTQENGKSVISEK